MNDEPNCWTCAYSNLPETAEPCASCDMYFSHFESTEPTQATATTASEDARRCSHCKFRDVPIVQPPCRKCSITPGLPCYTFDTNKLVEVEMMKREEAKQMEAEMLRRTCDTCRHRGDSVEEEPAEDKEETVMKPTCMTCKYKGVSIEEEPCISCNGYHNYTPDESARRKREEELLKRTCDHCKYRGDSVEEEPCASCDWYDNYTPDEATPCAEGTDENDDVIEPCNTCTHRDNLRCNPPCSHCRQERGIEYPEYEETEDIMKPSCESCKYKNLDRSVEPCHSCFYDRFGNPMNYVEATESGDEGTVGSGDEGTVGSGIKGIVPQHIVDMFAERVKQAALRFVNECNAYPRPCPYCGEIPEVVEETIYPGEKHCYVVCNGAKLLPHSISIHGRDREETVARWNSFVLTMKSQEK